VTETLAAYSLVAVYSAIAVYVLAFIVYVLDLAKRSASAQIAVPARAAAGSAASASTESMPYRSGATGVLERAAAAPAASGASQYQRTAFALTIVAWVLHVAAIVMRGIAAERVPWANMYEFALVGTGIMVGVFLLVNIWRDVKFLGAYITGIVALLLGLATVNVYIDIAPLPPALQSAWLVIHVFVATLGTGFFAVGAGLSIAQLLQERRENGKPGLAFLRTFPSSTVLENLAYRVVVVGFAFWTFTLIAGAIWAEHAWGRYWGWDTKEVWTFIIWVLFAGYIHARATRGWRGARSAWLAIIGFSAVLFNFTVVNLFFKGLHAYSGL
jgi:cytochrome c-type biogenesis protein CcsB